MCKWSAPLSSAFKAVFDFVVHLICQSQIYTANCPLLPVSFNLTHDQRVCKLIGLILILKPNPTKRPTVQPSKRPTQQPSSPRPTVSVFILIATIFAFLSICVLSFTKSSNIFTRLQTKQPTRQPTNPTELPSMQPTSPNVRSHKLVLSHIVCIDLMHMSHVMIVTTIIPI